MNPAAIELRGLSLGYGATRVLEDFSLAIEAGELMGILGPSGCGKSTLLRAVAGLMKPTLGDIRFGDASVLDVPAEKRNVGMVFQKALLFPHLSVAENVGFGLKMRGVAAAERRDRVAAAMELLRIEELAARKSHELSGGQEQRVALARALVTEPRVLLLDEPFSALDASLRGEMWTVLGELQRRMKITTLFVTHDQVEAVHLSDRIALLTGGRIEQLGAPAEFYRAPKTLAAARFFGWQVVGEMAFRPEAARLVPPPEADLRGEVRRIVHLGGRTRIQVLLEGGVAVEIEAEAGSLAPGSRVGLRIADGGIR